MVKSKVIFEDEEQVEIKYPCFELKDIVEYYFEICTPNNSITPFSLVALPNANILVSIYISDSSQTFKGSSLKVPWNNPILAKDSTYPIQEEWNISNAM